MNVAMNLAQGLPRHCLKAVRTRSARLQRGLCTRVSASAGAGEQYDFDLFTIGAGSGGVRGSRFASSYGAKVAVCELPFDYISSDTKGGVGGTCVLRGCVPKKLMVYAAEYADDFKASQGFGWTLPAGAATHSWTGFIEAKRKELQRLNGAYKNTLKNAKVELVEGRGRVVDAHTVEVTFIRDDSSSVSSSTPPQAAAAAAPAATAAAPPSSSFPPPDLDGAWLTAPPRPAPPPPPPPPNSMSPQVDGKRYRAKNILIAVGGKPHKLDIPGAELCITSDEALELPECPKKVAVLGSGYIAVEFAGIFSRFGAEVHTVYRQPLPLRGFDGEVRKFAAEQYAAAGLHLHHSSNPVSVSKQANGKLSLVVKGPDGATSTLTDLDQVMMATGRVPKTSGLGLEEAGVKMGSKGQVVVDEYCRTNVPSIWAVGDVIDRIQLTPVALMEGMAVAKSVALNTPTVPDYTAVPSAVFSNPEIATVGYSEEQAAEKFGDLDIYTTSFKPMRNTVSGSPLRTFMKVVVDAASQKVVGMHMVGAEAAEIMQGFAVAVKVGVTKQQLDSVVGIHPSAAEEFVTMRTVSRQVRKSA
ncbi:hypothetical protein HYH02_001010 [Chlamydomonas schloesseri]|uniref:Glutathione-disulfide reductase n=1 Tax=Chlamydomonas schloesseri TaxID=2026947 RepID=A0A835WVG8_9CHLO|nr:hypothetical protein HYH02_001010 [Chlamydomonas schloesseri]|eukprot:KAG2453963.1 hypothetical protein HYH02_001010 [Chlamydomonas schloesseri]